MPLKTDIELIYAIKETNDSAAITELVNRHTGIYVSSIQKYTIYPDFTNRVNVDDLKDEKATRIYEWATKNYDPNRGMKFSTFVGEMTTYMCKNLLRRGTESVKLDENGAASNETEMHEKLEHHSELEAVRLRAMQVPDPKFRRIFQLRFDGNKVRSWREIGRVLQMSHEAVRRIFNRHLPLLQKNLT